MPCPERRLICRVAIVLAWIAIGCIGSFLRLERLDERPLHADEATGAWILSERLEGQRYTFDPSHFHGPLLSATTVPLATVRGENSWQDLTATTLRLAPALAGIALLLTPLIIRRRIGNLAALGIAASIATSPLLVYYSRVYIHESLLTLCAAIALFCLYRFLRSPSSRNAVATGLAAGLMFATKETAAISFASWAIAGATTWIALRRDMPQLLSYAKPVAILAVAALLGAAIIYTKGFTEPAVFADAFRTYFSYETVPGHEKPFYYYLDLLVAPKAILGSTLCEAGLLLLCIIVGWRALRHDSKVRPIALFLASGAAAHFIVYSLIAYKTPWLMMVPWLHVCALAGLALRKVDRLASSPRIAVIALFAAALFYQTYQSHSTSLRFANHPQNPYAYVPSSRNLESLPNWLDAVQSANGSQLEATLIGGGLWPLPWYLRSTSGTIYQANARPDVSETPLIIALPENVSNIEAQLETTHKKFVRSLRPNVTALVFLRNDLHDTWARSETP